MIKIFRLFIVITALTVAVSGCASTETTTTPQQTEPDTPDFPSWYQTKAFESDSTSFAGYGEAVAGDSISAIRNAELQARANLETGVSELVEETRKSISESGNDTVDSPEFLIMLRNAGQAIEGEGAVSNKSAVEKEGYFRGYVKVSISKADAIDVFRSGLSPNPNYWQVLNSASLFE